MGWKERLRKASFRGVPFFWEDNETEGGRRWVAHEYLDQDDPWFEDMGKKPRGFSVEAYVIGRDYDLARNKLVKALDAAGPGELVHPYLGTLIVVAMPYSFSDDGSGMCRFRLTFAEAGKKEFPKATSDFAKMVAKYSEALEKVAEYEAKARMYVEQVGDFVRAAAKGEFLKLAGMAGDLAFPGLGTDSVAAFQNTVGIFHQTLAEFSGLTRDKSITAAGDIIRNAATMMATSEQSVSCMKRMREFIEDTEPQTTPSRVMAGINRAAVGTLVRTIAAAEQAKAVVACSYATYEEAIAAREDMVGFLDTLAETASDGSYNAIRDLQAQVAGALPPDGESLPRLARVQLADSLPSLVLAYDLYEGTSKAAEIVSRNGIRHPGFLPGGRLVEVLTRE